MSTASWLRTPVSSQGSGRDLGRGRLGNSNSLKVLALVLFFLSAYKSDMCLLEKLREVQKNTKTRVEIACNSTSAHTVQLRGCLLSVVGPAEGWGKEEAMCSRRMTACLACSWSAHCFNLQRVLVWYRCCLGSSPPSERRPRSIPPAPASLR